MTQLHAVQIKPEAVSRFVAPKSLDHAISLLSELGSSARPVAGGTDLLLELARNARPGIDTLVDLSRIPGLAEITIDDGQVEIGALVTHGDIVGSDALRNAGLPLAQACLEVGSPQLRNRATVVGNVVTASPANDTISALYALDADVTIASSTGTNVVPITAFHPGFRQTILTDGQLVTHISFKALTGRRRGIFVKLGLRTAQAISVVHTAVVVETDESDAIVDLRIAVGSVAPTVVLLDRAVDVADGRSLETAAHDVASFVATSVSPIDDLRATADYRSKTVEVMVERALLALARGHEATTWPVDPPRLTSTRPPSSAASPTTAIDADSTTIISAVVNGQSSSAANSTGRTLLDWLRDDLSLTGTKEGCAEGECGACTVHLNGQAVLACLVPATLAQDAEIVTVEGVANSDELDPVQAAFETCGGVQCGFCTPGFVMSSTMLISEIERPTQAQIEHGLAGNLCRCTGYYSIIAAVRDAVDAGDAT